MICGLEHGKIAEAISTSNVRVELQFIQLELVQLRFASWPEGDDMANEICSAYDQETR
jgi:hypothetical protein